MLPITGAMQKDFQRNITLRFGIRISQKKENCIRNFAISLSYATAEYLFNTASIGANHT